MKEQKSPKKPLLFYYAIVMLAVILFNSMVMPYFVRRRGHRCCGKNCRHHQ